MTLKSNIVGHLHNNSQRVEDEKMAEIKQNGQEDVTARGGCIRKESEGEVSGAGRKRGN
jgi:hypothetical protein